MFFFSLVTQLIAAELSMLIMMLIIIIMLILLNCDVNHNQLLQSRTALKKCDSSLKKMST